MELAAIIAASWWATIPLVALGSALHFVYDWSGHNRAAAIVGAVNESYWEHIKIAVWPVFLAQVVLFALGGWRIPAFVPAATIALYTVPMGMVGLVFLYKQVTKRNTLWLDITVFAAVIAIAQLVFTLLLGELAAGPITIVVAIAFLAGLVTAFLVYTLRPPAEPDVFIDPIRREYGVRGLHVRDDRIRIRIRIRIRVCVRVAEAVLDLEPLDDLHVALRLQALDDELRGAERLLRARIPAPQLHARRQRARHAARPRCGVRRQAGGADTRAPARPRDRRLPLTRRRSHSVVRVPTPRTSPAPFPDSTTEAAR